MAKRSFRPGRERGPLAPSSARREAPPTYPTLDDPDHGRRHFLVKLGGALLGAGALAACGGRSVQTQTDAGREPAPPHNMGGALPMDARVDQQPVPDGRQPEPPDGQPQQPDAAIDGKAPEPTLGKMRPPDALIDCDGGDCPAP